MDKEKRRQRAAYMREYTRANSEKIKAQRRARRTPETLKREAQWRAANREKVLAYKKVDRAKRPDDYRRWKKDWAARNSDELRERKRREYAANKEEISDRLSAIKKANPERTKKRRAESTARRRARLAEVEMEEVDRDVIFERDGGICQLCKKRVSRKSFSLDHIIPIVFGGPHTYLNIQLAHINCNKRRGHRGPAQLRLIP